MPGTVAAAALAVGIMLAPTTVVCSALLDTAAPPGTVTEAFAVTVMGIVVGTAIGNAVGGAIVDASSYRTAAVAAAGIAVAGAAAGWAPAADAAAPRRVNGSRYAASRRSLANCSVMLSSRPGSRTSSTSSPSWTTVSAFGTKPWPSRRIEMIRLALGQRDLADALPDDGRALRDLDLDDLELLVAEVEQVDRPVGRDLVLDQPQDQVGRAHRRLDAQQLEVLAVARVVDPGDDPLAEVLLLRELADEEVVLVVAGDGDRRGRRG